MPAQAQHFICPRCGARLRIQAQRRLDRRLPCPDCGQLLHLQTAPDSDDVRVTALAEEPKPPAPPVASDTAPSTMAVEPAASTAPPAPDSPGRRKRPGTRTQPEAQAPRAPAQRSPFGVVVILASVTGLLLIAFAIRTLLTPTGAPVDENPPPDDPLAVAESPADPPIDPAARPPGEIDSGNAEPATTERRLEQLGDQVELAVELQGAFPRAEYSTADLPRQQRFSWLAVLADQLEDPVAGRAQFDHPWNDPVNDRFVRRRMVAFQNPQVVELTGADGYPAGHFVGLAGNGAEALGDNPPHQVIGMFPLDRAVTVDRVLDGLSQTILVCGVTNQFGSWAAPGPPTVRAFTAPPVVGGPDGLGTADADGMLVLMADGRVDRIAADIDPDVFRRLVAIADETPSLPPDPQPGETAGPDDVAGPLTPRSAELVEVDPDDERLTPLEPEFADPREMPRRRVNVAQALEVRLLRFEQPPQELATVLLELSDILGVPIRVDEEALGDAAAGLKAPVTLSVRNTTVGDVLEGVLKQAKLTYHPESDHIQVVPRP